MPKQKALVLFLIISALLLAALVARAQGNQVVLSPGDSVEVVCQATAGATSTPEPTITPTESPTPTPSPTAAPTCTPGQSYYGQNNWIEYICGDMPLLISVPHGGYLTPTLIPNRAYGTFVRDENTQEASRDMVAAIYQKTGHYPHAVINLLDRIKLDPNREIVEAAQGNPYAEAAWAEYYNFIESISATLHIDFHTNDHTDQWNEFGYRLSAAQLSGDNHALNSLNYSLSLYPPAQVIRGIDSLGAGMQRGGFKTVPSLAYPSPGAGGYYPGGYAVGRSPHDAAQLEAYYQFLQSANRAKFVNAVANSILRFLCVQYGECYMANEVYRSDPNLQGLWLMEEDSGTRYDSSKNGNHLTDNNTVASSTDARQGARSADFEVDNAEYLSITDGSQTGLDITGNLSIVAWIKPESTSDVMRIVSKYQATSGNRSYQIFSGYGGGYTDIAFVLSNDGTTITVCYTSNPVISAGTWTHIAAVYNGTDMRVYINGSLSNNGTNNPKTYSSGIVNGAANFEIGRYDGNTKYFDGLIDEVAVFNRALSADEIAAIYNYGILPVGAYYYQGNQ